MAVATGRFGAGNHVQTLENTMLDEKPEFKRKATSILAHAARSDSWTDAQPRDMPDPQLVPPDSPETPPPPPSKLHGPSSQPTTPQVSFESAKAGSMVVVTSPELTQHKPTPPTEPTQPAPTQPEPTQPVGSQEVKDAVYWRKLG